MLMADCINEEEPFDTLSETDSSDGTQIVKVEHFAKCFISDCKESFLRIDKLYDHVAKCHYPIRFQCEECLMYTEKYFMILKHKISHHIGMNENKRYECFYCNRYNSNKLSDLVDHLMSCIITNNDKRGHKMNRYMKELTDAKSETSKNPDVLESINKLRVDAKTGKVYYNGKHVSSFPDQHSQISSKRKSLQTTLYNVRTDKHKIYEMFYGNSTNLLSPSGNIDTFLHKAKKFSQIVIRKSKKKNN